MSVTSKKENEAREQNAKKGLHYCAACKAFLPKENFTKAKRRKFGVSSYCKPCGRKRLKSSPSYKKLYKTSQHSELNVEQRQQAKNGLYYCNACKKYLPNQFFTPVKYGRFGKRNKCKICHNKNRFRAGKVKRQKIKIIIPKNLRHDIKYLMLYHNQSIEEVVTTLIINGLEYADFPQANTSKVTVTD